MMKTNRKLLVLFLCLSVLLLCGCGESEGNFGNETTAPIDRIINALLLGDVATYESAFPDHFVDYYRSLYPDLDEIIGELLSAGKKHDESAYGMDAEVTYELLSSEDYPVSLLEAQVYFQNIDSFLYDLPVDSVREAKALQISVTRQGSFSESERKLDFIVLNIDGKWVLHPEAFGTLFN